MSRTTNPALTSLESHPALAETASKLFFWAASETDATVFLRQALPLVIQTLGGDYLALAQGEKGPQSVAMLSRSIPRIVRP